MNARRILFALLLSILAVSASAGGRRLVILHTNDTHSHIDPDRSGPMEGCAGVIERAAYIDSVRNAEGKSHVLLLDAGDFDQGTSYFTVLKGDLEVRLLNDLRYDVVCLGNHEFDNGIPELARRLRKLRAEVLCANYDYSGFSDIAKIVKPYCIIRRGGFKIGVIGLLTDVRSVVDKPVADQLTYLDPIGTANALAAFLKEEKHCDLVLCLTHIGLDDVSQGCTDCDIAEKSRNIDLIVGGHTHSRITDKIVLNDLDGKPVVIVTDWKFGYEIGKLEITD